MSFVKFDYIEPVQTISTVDSKATDKLEVREPAMQPEKMVTEVALANRP